MPDIDWDARWYALKILSPPINGDPDAALKIIAHRAKTKTMPDNGYYVTELHDRLRDLGFAANRGEYCELIKAAAREMGKGDVELKEERR